MSGLMRTACHVAACCLLAGIACVAVPSKHVSAAADKSPSPARIAALVRQLGDRRYVVREQASRALAKIGVPAKRALESAQSNSDAEIRYRARRLLEVVLEKDFELRLKAFLKGPPDRDKTELPCWSRFCQLVGDSPPARRLFADMQRAERDVLAAAGDDSAAGAVVLETRCLELQGLLELPAPQGWESLSVPTIAALLLAASDPELPATAEAASHIHSFSYQQTFQDAIDLGNQADLLKPLLGAWVGRLPMGDMTAIYQNLVLALRFELREGIGPALAVVRAPHSQPQMRQYAILALAKLGGQSQMNDLAPLLNDTEVCVTYENGTEKIDTQVRDVALAALVHVTGQKLADYGFDRVESNSMFLFNATSLGFRTPRDRDQALDKWRAWTEDHLGEPPQRAQKHHEAGK